MSQALVLEKSATQQMIEERYRLLIEDKWEDKDEFGFVHRLGNLVGWALPNGLNLS